MTNNYANMTNNHYTSRANHITLISRQPRQRRSLPRIILLRSCFAFKNIAERSEGLKIALLEVRDRSQTEDDCDFLEDNSCNNKVYSRTYM